MRYQTIVTRFKSAIKTIFASLRSSLVKIHLFKTPGTVNWLICMREGGDTSI